MVEYFDVVLHAPLDSTLQLQLIHITAAHAICGRVERALSLQIE
jgi:hypothetical protein